MPGPWIELDQPEQANSTALKPPCGEMERWINFYGSERILQVI